MELIHPEYHKKFRCIGSACEDTCCHGWGVPIDKATYEKYVSLPPGPLTTLIHQSITLQPEEARANPLTFAQIEMSPTHQCPMLSDERLCRIQTQFGEELLSRICAVYPRVTKEIAGVREVALTLSCPEAARIVLLDPDLLSPSPVDSGLADSGLAYSGLADSGLPHPAPVDRDASLARLTSQLDRHAATDSDSPEQPSPILPWIWPIRRLVLSMIRNRAYPLWQRLFLLGLFCRRLEAIFAGEAVRGVDAFLRDFEATVASGSLRPAMETLPSDPAAQLDIVLRLAGVMLKVSNVLPRFAQCALEFTTGIGNGPGATIESLTRGYILANDRWLAPFLARHPHILENLLINTVFRTRFPLGPVAPPPQAPSSLTRQVEILTAQFVLTRGLLTGSAGFHRDSFSTDHVVFAVQSAAKHFEHHPDFLDRAHALLVESHMDGARGLAILVRDATAGTQQSGQVPVGEVLMPAGLDRAAGRFTPLNQA
jgi:lysine-N-methylase